MNLESQPDRVLIDAILVGNRQALGILYKRYGELVYALALRILQNKQDAEDLTQEVFMKFLQQGKFDDKKGTVPAYLLTITRSRAIDIIRHRKSYKSMIEKVSNLLSESDNDMSLDNISSQEISKKIYDAIAI